MTMSSCESISRRPIKSRLSSSPPHPVNTKCSKSLNHKTTQSQSDTTKHTPKSFPSHVKRCSLGSITGTKKPISSIHHAEKTIWRSPGHCEIPNILGNAYLQLKPVEQHRPKKSKPLQAGPTRPPWYPACATAHWTPPPLAPLNKPLESSFEKRLKKAIPKIQLLNNTNPKSRYMGSKEVGTGVNGAVVQVTVRGHHDIRLALKRCKLDDDREYRAAIVRELRIMASGHTNLIKLREAIVFQNEVWMAMDLMLCSVFAVLCRRNLPEQYAIYIVRETLNGLIYLHNRGFIHRDVKCENLLIGNNGEIKLADFGLATSMKHTNRERLGTAKWMAPEVIRQEAYNEKVDLWSLGITLIEMMDRVPPHYAVKRDEDVFIKILEDSSPTFTYSYPSIYCTGLVAWLLEENVENRPTARDVVAELDLHIEQKLLKMVDAKELARFVSKTLA